MPLVPRPSPHAHRYIQSFDHLVQEAARLWEVQRMQLVLQNASQLVMSEAVRHPRLNVGLADDAMVWNEYVRMQGRGGEHLLTCDVEGAPTTCVSPIIYQSWYDVFLPLWMGYAARGGVRIVFSDDFYGREHAALQELTAFLGLPRHAYDVSYVKNNQYPRSRSNPRLASGDELVP